MTNLPALATIDTFRNKIVNCDALTLLRSLPAGSVGTFVTSPPYNLRNTTGGGMPSGKRTGKWSGGLLAKGYTAHDDNMPHAEYVAWQRACLTEMMRIIPSNGAIFYNHKWRVQGGLLQDRADIIGGFPVRQIIIWERAGGTNFNPRFFLPTYEVIYLIAKPDFKIAPTACGYGDVWHIPQEADLNHEAPFPLELPRRCIEAAYEAKVIGDPFMGRGTTARAARISGRDYVGCDNNPAHVTRAKQWIDQPYTISMFAIA
jgi:modification methylase